MKFRNLDKITGWEAGRRATGIKAVSFEEYCLKQAFGGPERLPESLALQALIELAGWLVALSTDFRQTALPTDLGPVEFADRLRPGERLELTVEAVATGPDRWTFSGRGLAGGREIIRCSGLEAGLLPLDQLEDPADRRTLFSEIFQEPGKDAR